MATQNSTRIAFDAMGGDFAPGNVIESLELVDWSLPLEVLLVGPPEVVDEPAQRYERVTAVHSQSVVEMKESASEALKKKRDSSIGVAVGLIKQGHADAIVSAGNTGAVMGFSLFGIGRIPGVERPAILAAFPTGKQFSCLIDVGANVDCKPEFLTQFAIMGSIYFREIWKKPNPRVALLNIGSEPSKGNEQAQAAYKSLEQAPINFVGNAEGRAFMRSDADVFVCDGFLGNIMLKFGEGYAEWFFVVLKEHIEQVADSSSSGEKLRSLFKDLSREFDYSEYGGAVLLGIKGTCIICHGSSSPKAFASALRMAHETHTRNIHGAIESAMANFVK